MKTNNLLNRSSVGLRRLLKGGVDLSQKGERQIEDSPFRTYDEAGGTWRQMRKDDYLKLDKNKPD